MIGLFGQKTRAACVTDGRLAACPSTPNCVCSMNPPSDRTHFIEPLRFADAPEDAWRRLQNMIARQPRAKVITASGSYLHAEFRTALLRFVDDVEFLLDKPAGVIHVRSASRLGRSDFGTNRRRIESLRADVATFE
jgi:uncharacterized protein (DUF1499 family)